MLTLLRQCPQTGGKPATPGASRGPRLAVAGEQANRGRDARQRICKRQVPAMTAGRAERECAARNRAECRPAQYDSSSGQPAVVVGGPIPPSAHTQQARDNGSMTDRDHDEDLWQEFDRLPARRARPRPGTARRTAAGLWLPHRRAQRKGGLGIRGVRPVPWNGTCPHRRGGVHQPGAVAAARTDGADRGRLRLGLQPAGAPGTQPALHPIAAPTRGRRRDVPPSSSVRFLFLLVGRRVRTGR
jgi:hypothetical protein